MPKHNDSVDKIITRYFATLTKVSFVYNGVEYKPRPLRVSPLLLRGYTCPEGCGGCCPRFSLDYLPHEPHQIGLGQRLIKFDGREIHIHSDLQNDHDDHHCRHLDAIGRCGIYELRPFSCDFELIRPLMYENGPNMLTQKLYGRGHSFLRVDDERGALCEMTDPDDHSIKEVVRKLRRLEQWADHFGIITWADTIIKLIEQKRLTKQITLSVTSTGFGIIQQ